MQQQLPHNIILNRLRESAKLVHSGDSINIVLYDLDKISDNTPEILEYFADDLRQLYANPLARERAFKLTIKLLNYWFFHRYVCDTSQPVPPTDMNAMSTSCSVNSILNRIATPVPPFAECLELEAPVDPEPTDYSQRYKERPVDELTAGRGCSKAVAEEVNASEDTVKVYRTEGTPHNFSLASSLTDLRDCSGFRDGFLGAINALHHVLNSSSCGDIASVTANHNNTPEDSSNTGAKLLAVPSMRPKPSLPPKPAYLEKKAIVLNGNHSNHAIRNNDLISSSSGCKMDANSSNNNINNGNKCVTFDTRILHHSVSDECVAVSVNDELCCADETPLMYSRCSSLESLSSCGVKSLCCESSVVSEFSRRASEVVSPSDLPDSPFEELPPVVEQQSSHNINAKPVAYPRGVKIDKCVLSGDDDNNAKKPYNGCISNGEQHIYENIDVFGDTAVNYAMEGMMSGALSISLSSLCISDVKLEFDENAIDDDVSNNNNDRSIDVTQQPNINGHNTERIIGSHIEGGVCCSKSIDVSSEDENEEQLLAGCISLGMKKQFDDKANNTILCYNNRRQQHQHSQHQKMSEKEVTKKTKPPPVAIKPNTLNIPPMIVTPKQHSIVHCNSRSSPDGRSSYLESDSVRAHRTREHTTPTTMTTIATLSRSTSTSEFQLQDQSSLIQSDYSDDDEHALLQRCIESGMMSNASNNGKYRKNAAKRSSSSTFSSKKVSPITPKTTPNISPNACLLSDSNGHNKALNGDQMKHFFVEDTPVFLSKCHSLSSLSFDSDDDDNDIENYRLLQEAINCGRKTRINECNNLIAAPNRRHNNSNNNSLKVSPKSDDELMDDKTYTICNQMERKNQIKNEANKMIDSVMMLSSSAMTDSSCGGGALSDLESTKPPSLMNSIMMSSCESASFSSINQPLQQQHKQIPVPKPRRSRSANYLKSNSVEEKPSSSFIEDVKPPSLMNDISSLLSQSFDASVSSDISDISLDFIDIAISKSNENVANAAINCARELNTLTVSCNNAANTLTEMTDRIDRIEPPSLFHRINDLTNPKPINNLLIKQLQQQHNNDYDMSDTEVSEELPIDSEDIILAMKQSNASNRNSNHFEHSFTSSSATLLPLESPTVCAELLTTDFDSMDDENQQMLTDRQRYLDTFIAECDKIMEQSLTDDDIECGEKRMAPIGSEHFLPVDDDEQLSLVSGTGAGADDENDDEDSELDSRATYNVTIPRRARIVKPVARKSKASKESQQQQHYSSRSPMLMRSAVISVSSSSSKPLSGAHHRCVVKGTRTSALRASRSRSVDYHYDSAANEELLATAATKVTHHEKIFTNNNNSNSKQHYKSSAAKQCIVYVNEDNNNLSGADIRSSSSSGYRSQYSNNTLLQHQHSKEEKSSGVGVNSSGGKSKEKSLFSNMRSRLSASLSSHNLGASNVSLSSSSSNGFTPVTCSSFSRKLEVQSRIASLWKRSKSVTTDKASPNDFNTNGGSISSVAKNNLSKTLDLTRSVVCRRSFAKSSKNSAAAKLTRSSTFEKLPQSGDEASALTAVDFAPQYQDSKKCAQHCSNSGNNNSNAYKINSFSKKHNNIEAQQQQSHHSHNSDKLNSNLMTTSAKYVKNSGTYFANISSGNINNNNNGNTTGQRISASLINNNSNVVNNNTNNSNSNAKEKSSSKKSGGKSRRTILVTAV